MNFGEKIKKIIKENGYTCKIRYFPKEYTRGDKNIEADFEKVIVYAGRNIEKIAQKRSRKLVAWKNEKGEWKGIFGLSKEDIKKRIHPTQKPTRLIEWFLTHFSKDNDLIVDLFLGSGSTLIACEKTNRIAFGMEIDEHYCDVIIKRWEDFTGLKANKVT